MDIQEAAKSGLSIEQVTEQYTRELMERYFEPSFRDKDMHGILKIVFLAGMEYGFTRATEVVRK